ncbi:MAG TPA: squalene/phytoene synthase family protein [Solirubrobacteraceae bacterium]
MSTSQELARDYARCEAITRRQAANFYYGIRLLPRDRRHAMSAVYAFARRIDDIGDGTLATAEKLRLLDAEAQGLARIEAGGAVELSGRGDPVMSALADARSRFPPAPGTLGELIEGVRMDIAGVSYESFEELVLYCRRVAGAIGRVCLAIFGLREEHGSLADAEVLADDLGVALQITNILRDIREDAENGRVYLPAEDLRRFGLLDDADGEAQADTAARIAALAQAAASPELRGAHAEDLEQMAALVRFEAARGREWFARGMTLGPLLDRRSAACLMAMAGIYRRLLDRIERDPLGAFASRMSLPAREKALVAARGMLGSSA